MLNYGCDFDLLANYIHIIPRLVTSQGFCEENHTCDFARSHMWFCTRLSFSIDFFFFKRSVWDPLILLKLKICCWKLWFIDQLRSYQPKASYIPRLLWRKSHVWFCTRLSFSVDFFFKGLFGICLFCWNWKLFAESTENKGKS